MYTRILAILCYTFAGFQQYFPIVQMHQKWQSLKINFCSSNCYIPTQIWQAALVYEDQETKSKHHQMDTIWAYLKALKSPNEAFSFKRLATVALLVVTLPHSNAEEECSVWNKTKFRQSLKLDGTLSSILTIKLAKSEPCHKYNPSAAVIKSAKKATTEYNRVHSSKQ